MRWSLDFLKPRLPSTESRHPKEHLHWYAEHSLRVYNRNLLVSGCAKGLNRCLVEQRTAQSLTDFGVSVSGLGIQFMSD